MSHRGLALRYRKTDAGTVDPDEYIEKTISLSFDLPPLRAPDAQALLRACAVDVPLTDDDVARVVALRGTNPRRLKRLGRALTLLFGIARAAQEPLKPAPWPLRDADRPLFLKLSLLAYRNSGVFGLMVRDAGLPRRLQEAANVFDNTCAEKVGAQALIDLSGSIEVEHQVVLGAARDPVLWRILATKPEFPEDP
jgi:hypothetical protein